MDNRTCNCFFFLILFCLIISTLFLSPAQSSNTLVESLRDLIENSEIGPLLGELPHQHFLMYLMDFVHMVYKPASDSEYEVLVLLLLGSLVDILCCLHNSPSKPDLLAN